MEWFPAVFIAFKVIVLGIGMYFAVKWHYEKEEGAEKRRAVLRACAKLAVIFVVLAAILLALTFGLGSMLGLDLSAP